MRESSARAREMTFILDAAVAARPDFDRITQVIEVSNLHVSDRDIRIHLDYVDPGARRARMRLVRARPVVAVAGRLLAVAARVLPAGERARYAEEFRYELWEVARAGGGRGAQVAYALRLVASAWRLRGELRVPQRRGATP